MPTPSSGSSRNNCKIELHSKNVGRNIKDCSRNIYIPGPNSHLINWHSILSAAPCSLPSSCWILPNLWGLLNTTPSIHFLLTILIGHTKILVAFVSLGKIFRHPAIGTLFVIHRGQSRKRAGWHYTRPILNTCAGSISFSSSRRTSSWTTRCGKGWNTLPVAIGLAQ